MRDRGRYTPMQGRTLPERMEHRIGEDTEALTAPVDEQAAKEALHGGRKPPAIDPEFHREEEDIVDTPVREESLQEYEDWQDEKWMRAPLGDT